MRTRFIPHLLLLFFLIGLLVVAGCRSQAGGESESVQIVNASREVVEVGATASPTASLLAEQTATKRPTLAATIRPPATATTVPTSTPATTATAKATETTAPSPTVNVTATVASLAAADPVDRTCPEPPPGKPDYRHFYLSGERWPAPAAEPEEHFWLDKPLPGGGRLLFTDWLPYGYDAGGRYLLHNGIDVAEPLGTPILAAAEGTVIVAGDDTSRLFGWRCDWYGHLVVIELDQRWRDQPVYVVYGHVLELTVRPGERVEVGQQVAEVGVGGAARLPHLHFEVRVGSNEFGATRNPLLWLKPPATRGIIAGRLVDPEGRPWQGVTVAAVGRSEGTETHTTWTYLGDPQDLINPDEVLAENFVLADLKPGEYELYVEVQGEVYTLPVSVQGGQLISVEIVTEPFKPPAPEPPAEPSPEATATESATTS